MIKENQKLLNQLNILSDGGIVFFSYLLSYLIRFMLMDSGENVIPLRHMMLIGLCLIPLHMITYQILGLYDSFRHQRLHQELARLLYGTLLDFVCLLVSVFVVLKYVNFSRLMLGTFFLVNIILLSGKRYALRKCLQYYRKQGYNQKHVIVVGCGDMAIKYWQKINKSKELGYQITGYISDTKLAQPQKMMRRLGNYAALKSLLEKYSPDEVVVTLGVDEYTHLTDVIAACEKTGIKMSIIPFYSEFFPANPQIDFIDDIPMINLRRIPLDNFGNATLKRAMDILGSLGLILVFSPVMLAVAIGVKISSPGPVIFKQKRVGRDKKTFYMYKFRSMTVNTSSDVAWSTNHDSRKTKFGAFIRKCSLDEFPQFFNVLKGDMSLVGPRPELPHFVDQFKEDVPLYMVKHQVRPGITGWAQVSGFRGDTSIRGRIEHDIYYIEHWTILFDIKILLFTLFKGVINNEKIH